MRGENAPDPQTRLLWAETPPLARRKLVPAGYGLDFLGNTSACAEKTICTWSMLYTLKKHLRLRGENANGLGYSESKVETPPLARRKLLTYIANSLIKRNTSACAEKTFFDTRYAVAFQKHLRLRGENPLSTMVNFERQETPPLARRKLRKDNRRTSRPGNTSACAEKTTTTKETRLNEKKHLRLRGENVWRSLI